MEVINRAGPNAVALETTLPVHGVPRERAPVLCGDLVRAVRGGGAEPAFVGVVGGRAIVGMTREELDGLLTAPPHAVAKANTANLGVLAHRGANAATTVSTTLELAAGAGVRVAATGALGGIHRGYGTRLDVSADLAALARFPVAVVCSGVKSLLDVEATREALESLGVPVIGFGTERFPAFYLRESAAGVDARFDDEDDLAAFLRAELARTGRAVVVAQPVPESAAVSAREWAAWLSEAERRAAATGAPPVGRAVTPEVLGALHAVSGGRTLEANVALAVSNAALAGRLCARLLRA